MTGPDETHQTDETRGTTGHEEVTPGEPTASGELDPLEASTAPEAGTTPDSVHALSSSPAEERTKEQGAAPVVQPAEEPEVSENDGSSFAGALSEVEARVEVAKATKGAVVGEKRATTRRSTPRKAPPAPAAKQAADAGAAAVGPVRPTTLAIDIGGTGLKASVLDADGKLVADRVRVATPHPCPTKALIDALATLIAPLPSFGRVSVGFPGVVRKGVVLTAPHLVARHGTPKSPPVPKLVAEWAGFDLETALSERFGRPVRVINDADLQGLDVVSGSGLEFVVTLGTGVGTALFLDGRLAPHLELSHHPFRKGETYDEQLGDATLRRIGFKKWQKRLEEALGNFQRLINYDRLYIGGGNARLLVGHLDPSVTIVDNLAGILGGIKLWELPHH